MYKLAFPSQWHQLASISLGMSVFNCITKLAQPLANDGVSLSLSFFSKGSEFTTATRSYNTFQIYPSTLTWKTLIDWRNLHLLLHSQTFWTSEHCSNSLSQFHVLGKFLPNFIAINRSQKLPSYVALGDRGGTVVKVLCYKSEGRWFDPRWCHWNFSLT